MPQGLKWSSTEVADLAKAWVNASDNAVHGADQSSPEFWDDVVAKMRLLRPALSAQENGHYWERGREAIHAYWRDHVKKDVQDFNKALRKVFEAHPTGTTLQEMICMAVAIHLKKVNRMDYHFKNFDVHKWRFYSAWLCLRNTNKFRYAGPVPHSVEQDARQVGILDNAAAGEEEQDSGDQQPNIVASAARRGGGPGQKKSKKRKQQEGGDEDHKTPKQQQEEILRELSSFKETAKGIMASVDQLCQERHRSTNVLLECVALDTFPDDPEVQERVRSRIRQRIFQESSDEIAPEHQGQQDTKEDAAEPEANKKSEAKKQGGNQENVENKNSEE